MAQTWVLQSPELEDVDAIGRLVRAEEVRVFGQTETDVRDFAQRARADADFATNTVVVRGTAGILAVARIQKRRAEFAAGADLEPDVREALLDWAEGRQRELERPQLIMCVVGPDPEAVALLQRRGYEPERSYLRMRRDAMLSHPPEVAPVPDGYQLRPVDLDADAETLWQLCERGFGDRPDHTPMPTLEEYRREHRDFALMAPQWSRIAEAPDGEPVGSVVAWRFGGEGFIAELSVVPEHRRRTLARALLTASMALSCEAGRDGAALMVASDNPRAKALYESVGMSEQAAWHDWRREP